MRRGWQASGAAALAALLAVLPAGAGFQPPSDDGGPFRRDRLPLDVDMMRAVADDLVLLARQAGRAGAPERLRAAAQLLALADTLDPARSDVTGLLEGFARGATPAPPPAAELAQAQPRAWKLHRWLADSAAGSDAGQFAACLGDALAVASPEGPRASKLREAGEQGRWQGWVAELAAFRRSAEPTPPAPPDEPDKADKSDPPVAEPSGPVAVQLASASVLVPLHRYDPKLQKSIFGAFPLALKASSAAAGESKEDGASAAASGYTLVTDDSDGEGPARDAMKIIRQQLTRRHGGLPPGGRARLTVGSLGGYDWTRNRDAGVAAIGLLLDASLSGQAPADRLLVLATLAPDGTLELPWRAWEALRALAEDPDIPNGRFILPRQALPLLDGLLVMERPDFFLRFEVVLAGDFGELVERAAAAPEGGQAAAAAAFAEVREASGNQQLGPYLANRFVRERLGELVKGFPDHGSARLLLKQGAGERPVTYETTILARELRHALKPMAWVARAQGEDLTGEALGEAFSATRALVDVLERRVARNDQELFAAGFEVAQRVRTLSNALARARKGRTSSSGDAVAERAFQKEHQRLAKDHAALMERIDLLTGEAKPEAAAGQAEGQGEGKGKGEDKGEGEGKGEGKGEGEEQGGEQGGEQGSGRGGGPGGE